MSSYDTEQTRTVRPRRTEGEGGGAFDAPIFGYGRRPWSETKPFFLTSEFLILLVVSAAIAIAMAVADNFDSPRGWLLITIIAAAYIVSRGLAKAGTRDPNPQHRDHH